ncbi:MAG: MFS transporter, partial [Dehalococcoidia bacterium]
FNLYMGQVFDASPFRISNFMAITCISLSAVSSQLGRINRWLSLGNIIKLSFVVTALSLALVPQMPSMWFLLIPGIINGMALGANIPSLQTAIASMAPLEHRGAFMSINATIIRAGQAIGPLLVGLFYVYGGFDGAFYATAGLALVAPVVAILVGWKIKPKEV